MRRALPLPSSSPHLAASLPPSPPSLSHTHTVPCPPTHPSPTPPQPSAFTEEDEDESAFVNCRPLVPLVPGGAPAAAAPPPADGAASHCGLLYGNEPLFVLLRLHQFVYERMRAARSCALQVRPQQPRPRPSRCPLPSARLLPWLPPHVPPQPSHTHTHTRTTNNNSTPPAHPTHLTLPTLHHPPPPPPPSLPPP